MPARLIEFCTLMREQGVQVGTSELLDAFEALGQVSWADEAAFREALAACVAKGPEERRCFNLLFESFLFRAAEREALQRSIVENVGAGSAYIDLEELSEAIERALISGSDGELRDLARLAIAAFGQGDEGSGVIGVDLQRIRRTLGLRRGSNGGPRRPLDASEAQARLRHFERILRRELERSLIEREGKLPPSKPLAELDRTLPVSPAQDLAAVQRTITQLKRRLATMGQYSRGRRRTGHVDIRHTMRASLETGGVPLKLKYRPKRPRRPEIYVLCDVSTSVSSASVFFLTVLHALHDAFRKLRSFVFVERISEVTEIFEREHSFKAISERVSSEGGVADISGYTDYGRVWLEFYSSVVDDLGPRSTVIVLGDARTNGREPHAKVFSRISERAGRTFWLNPEPKLYWNYGDSVIAAYEPYCDGAFECWTTKQLEEFVKVVVKTSHGG